MTYEEQFERARKAYPGTVRGFETEFRAFKKWHKDWKEVLPLLLPAIEKQIQSKKIKDGYWKHFKTWLHQRWWEAEYDGKQGVEFCRPRCKYCGKESHTVVSGTRLCSMRGECYDMFLREQ